MERITDNYKKEGSDKLTIEEVRVTFMQIANEKLGDSKVYSQYLAEQGTESLGSRKEVDPEHSDQNDIKYMGFLPESSQWVESFKPIDDYPTLPL